jgi:hypothetical protein
MKKLMSDFPESAPIEIIEERVEDFRDFMEIFHNIELKWSSEDDPGFEIVKLDRPLPSSEDEIELCYAEKGYRKALELLRYTNTSGLGREQQREHGQRVADMKLMHNTLTRLLKG